MESPLNNLSVQDFLENGTFLTWMKERRPEDRVFWQEWLEKNPGHQEVYEQAVAAFLVLEGEKRDLSEPQVAGRVKEILDQLVPDEKTHRFWYRSRLVAAAVALLVAAAFALKVYFEPVSVFFETGTVASVTKDGEWIDTRNTTAQPIVVILPDRSSVLLSGGSSLRYRSALNVPVREVHLQGEGFFEVEKKPGIPFVVYTNKLTTKVLGTSFMIRSFENESRAHVKVKTGRVTVTTAGRPDNQIFLNVNEQLNLDIHADQVITQGTTSSGDAVPEIISETFVFEYEPVTAIFDLLASTYHIPIRYDPATLKGCTFTGELNDTPFLEKIRLICLTIDSRFEMKDNEIRILSDGCH